jgi:hypothetical protein
MKKEITRARRGAPNGNANALKHGNHTRARRALFAEIRAHIDAGHTLDGAVRDWLESRNVRA